MADFVPLPFRQIAYWGQFAVPRSKSRTKTKTSEQGYKQELSSLCQPNSIDVDSIEGTTALNPRL
jgi:hypothetical protein